MSTNRVDGSFLGSVQMVKGNGQGRMVKSKFSKLEECPHRIILGSKFLRLTFGYSDRTASKVRGTTRGVTNHSCRAVAGEQGQTGLKRKPWTSLAPTHTLRFSFS